MGPINLGPGWFWNLIMILAAIGVISGIVWVVKGIIWLFNHVHIS